MSFVQIGQRVDAGRDPIVALAADENFAMPLAVTVRSALERLSPERMLRIYVMDAGLTDATKERLERSWADGRYEVTWVSVDSSALGEAPISGHVNLVSYYRILMPRVLPADVDRVIYLDADLVICADLAQLWDCELAGQLCLAAQDCAAPYLDAAVALENYAVCGRHLGSPRPIANYRELGLSPGAAYFNAGVLLVDLAGWRAGDLSGQMIACLEANKRYVRWWDQYAMNVVLAGRWVRLMRDGIKGPTFFRIRRGLRVRSIKPHTRGCETILTSSTSRLRYKPWLMSCLHPSRKQFFEVVDRTAWAGWRPWHTMRLRPFLDLAKAQERRLRIGWRQLRDRRAG